MCCIESGEKSFNGIKRSCAGEGAFHKVIITSGIGRAAQIGGWCGVVIDAITDDTTAIQICTGLFFQVVVAEAPGVFNGRDGCAESQGVGRDGCVAAVGGNIDKIACIKNVYCVGTVEG